MMKSLNSHFICDWQSVKIANSGNFPLRTILGYVLDASFKDLKHFCQGFCEELPGATLSKCGVLNLSPLKT